MAGSSSMNKNTKRMTEDEKIEKHTQIFASMCPDEILDHYDDYNTREYYTTLMLGDISGFTEVAEKYTNAGKGGPSKLTETLNSYIGAMVQEILSHQGDVLKFSGDAFIVMWKLRDGLVMRDLANEAMQTACVIQKHFGTYETDVGITLRVKLAIASGKIYFTSIGDPERISHYIITGKPVWDVKHAEGLCRGGDILVAQSSWQWANPTDYVFKNLSDGIHTLILASSTMWEHSKDEYDATEEKTPTESILLSSVTSNLDPHQSDSDGSVNANFGEQIEKNQLQSLQSHVDYTREWIGKLSTIKKRKLFD